MIQERERCLRRRWLDSAGLTLWCLARPRRPRKIAPSDTEGRRGTASSQRKRAASPRAQTARSRRKPPRATRRAKSACARGAPLARSPARESVRPLGVQPARPHDVQPTPSGAPGRAPDRRDPEEHYRFARGRHFFTQAKAKSTVGFRKFIAFFVGRSPGVMIFIIVSSRLGGHNMNFNSGIEILAVEILIVSPGLGGHNINFNTGIETLESRFWRACPAPGARPFPNARPLLAKLLFFQYIFHYILVCYHMLCCSALLRYITMCYS